MAEAVIVTEEECKENLDTPMYRTEATHSNRVTHLPAGMNRKLAILKPFLKYGTSPTVQYGTSQSVQDGLLPVHPLVLEVPAILRAATSMMMSSRTVRDASVDRIVISTGPAAQSSSRSTSCHVQRPHVRTCAALPPSRILMRARRKTTGERDCRDGYWHMLGSVTPEGAKYPTI